MREENPKIIVCGNQKSGTNVIGQLLAWAGGMSGVMDLVSRYGNFTDPLKLDGKEEFQSLVEDQPEAVDHNLIKCSQFTFIADWLESVWPGITLVFVLRDPRATIRSQLDRIDHPGHLDRFNGNLCYRFSNSWRNIISGGLVECSRDHYISTLAARWAKAARAYLERQNRAILIRYEDFCRAKAKEIYDLASRCGVDVREDISGMVDHQWQVRGHNRGCDWREFFGQENLERIQQECAGEMQLLGYHEMEPDNV